MSAATAGRVLDEAAGVSATAGVMAAMLFLLVLAAAGGLATRNAAAALRRLPDVRTATPVGRAELARVTAAVRPASTAARVDRHEAWMSPVGALMRSLTGLAAGLVLLMAGAAAAVAALAARAGLETHRPTVRGMHMLGATDRQVARLFGRRVAIGAALGGGVGAVAALVVAWLIGRQVDALGSGLLGGAALAGWDAALLLCLPVLFVGGATLAARWAVLAAARRAL